MFSKGYHDGRFRARLMNKAQIVAQITNLTDYIETLMTEEGVR